MEEIEKAKQEALEKLRKIQTLEDVKEHDQEIVDTMVEFLTGAVEIMRAWFQDILSLDPEAKHMEIVKFQNDNFLADDEVNMELDRISGIPGADEHLDPFLEQLEERLTPVMEETGEIMEKLMSELGGAMMGGLEETFRAQEEEEVIIDGGSSFKDEQVQFYAISKLNDIRDMVSFNYDKNEIGFWAEECINGALESLGHFKNAIVEDGGRYEDFKDWIEMAERKKDLLVQGINTEMDRIATLPKAADEAVKIRDECLTKIDPQVKEIEGLVKELRGK